MTKKYFHLSKTSFLYIIRWEIILFIILFFLYSTHYVFSEKTHDIFWGDYYLYRQITHSIAYDYDLKIDNNFPPPHPGDTGRALGKDNVTHYPRLPWIMPLFGAPVYRIFGEDNLGVMNLICMILGIYFVYFLLRPLVGSRIAFIAVLINGFSTVLFEWGYHYATDVFIIPFITGGLALWINDHPILAGMTLAIGGIGKHYYWIFLPLLLITNFYLIYRKSRNSNNKKFSIMKRIIFSVRSKNVLGFSIGSLLILILYGYVNYSMFGSPFVNGYRRTILSHEDGSYTVLDHTQFFHNPIFKGIEILFLRRNIGIVYYSPFTILLLPIFVISLFMLITQLISKSKNIDIDNLKFFIIFLGLMISFIVVAIYSMNVMSEYGNRFLLSHTALSSVPLAYLIEKIFGKIK